jgi:glycosyltransferase involved in cell wall biosynthesis
MSLRLGFYYHVPASMRDGQIVMPGYQGCFVDSLATHCEKVTCFLHSPVSQDHFTGDYAIRSTNVELVDIGPHTSVTHRTLFAHRFVHPLVIRRDELDILLLRGPSPLLPEFAEAAGRLPITLLLVGEYLAGVDDLPQPRWRKELIRLWSHWNQQRQLNVAKHSLTFVNSHKLFQELEPNVPHLVETRTTTLSQADFYNREDTCNAPPYHLLYTGRMARAKGLSEMVSALALLVARNYDCILDLVGMVEKGDPILTEIHQQTIKLGISERVIYHGYKPLGPELYEFYRKADIYLIASKSSFEGFPRTIWEAMANSLPVIATRVGSIPDFVEGAAELIEPRDATLLVLAIEKLISHPQYRQILIQTGYQLAQKNTLEVRSLEMLQHIEEYLSNQGG